MSGAAIPIAPGAPAVLTPASGDEQSGDPLAAGQRQQNLALGAATGQREVGRWQDAPSGLATLDGEQTVRRRHDSLGQVAGAGVQAVRNDPAAGAPLRGKIGQGAAFAKTKFAPGDQLGGRRRRMDDLIATAELDRVDAASRQPHRPHLLILEANGLPLTADDHQVLTILRHEGPAQLVLVFQTEIEDHRRLLVDDVHKIAQRDTLDLAETRDKNQE